MARGTRFAPILAVVPLLLLCTGLSAQPTVTSVSPPENDLDALLTAQVTASFSGNMSAAAAGTFVVHGSMTGE